MTTTKASISGTASGKGVRFTFGTQVLVGMAIGIALGFVARAIGPDAAGDPNQLSVTLKTVGSIFIGLLSATVPPLIFAAIVSSITNLKDLDNAARLAWQTLAWFAITAFIAVVIGIGVGLIVQPGTGSHPGLAATASPATVGTWLDFLKGLVPANFLGITASSKVADSGQVTTGLSFNTLQILVISLAVGFASLKAGERAEPFVAFVRSLLAVVRTILGWIIKLTPIGSAALIGAAIAMYGWGTLLQLGSFAFAVYLGLFLVIGVVYPVLLAFNGIRPSAFFREAWPAIQLAFVSRSSVGTMPVTELAAERLGVPNAYAAFAVPLAATTKMDGCASIYPALAAIFVANFYGVPLHGLDYLLIVLVSVLGSAATAGMTGAVVMLTLTLSTLGLPLAGAGLLLAIDPILDMGRTAVNVAGQLLVTLIVSKREGLTPSLEPVHA